MSNWGGPWSSLLRRLVVPFNAGPDDPRVVIQTDDPIMELLNLRAGIMWYINDDAAFMLAVEQSGSPDRGQFHLNTVDSTGLLAQWLDIDHNLVGAEADMVFGQSNVRNVDFAMTGDFAITSNARTIIAGTDIYLGGLNSDTIGRDIKMFNVSAGRGLRGLISNSASSAAIGAEAVAMNIVGHTWRAGRAYEVIVGGQVSGSVANTATWQLRRNNLAGVVSCVIGATAQPVAATNYALNLRQVVRRNAGTDNTQTVVLTVAASAGTVTHVAAALNPRYLEIRDIGASADYPFAPAM